MQQLKTSDFRWHSDQPDLPQMEPAALKEFFDAPARTLMEAVNTLAEEGAERETKLTRLQQQTTEVEGALEQTGRTAETGLQIAEQAAQELALLRDSVASEVDTLQQETAALSENLSNFVESGQNLSNIVETLSTVVAGKQDAFTVGAGLTLEKGVLSSTGGAGEPVTVYQPADYSETPFRYEFSPVKSLRGLITLQHAEMGILSPYGGDIDGGVYMCINGQPMYIGSFCGDQNSGVIESFLEISVAGGAVRITATSGATYREFDEDWYAAQHSYYHTLADNSIHSLELYACKNSDEQQPVGLYLYMQLEGERA